MSETKPLPIRISEVMWQRLENAVNRTGLKDRTAVIKICLILFLDYLETHDYHLPVDIDIEKMIKQGDGRTRESRSDEQYTFGLPLVAEKKPVYKIKKKNGGNGK